MMEKILMELLEQLKEENRLLKSELLASKNEAIEAYKRSAENAYELAMAAIASTSSSKGQLNKSIHRIMKDNKRVDSESNNWKNVLKKVYDSDYEMLSEIEKSPEMRVITYGHKCLPSGKEDSAVVAGLVALPGRSEVTNFAWSTYYKYPMVFAKATIEELETLTAQLLSNEDVRDAGRTANAYVEELEKGNFIARCKNKESGEYYYVGYMVEQEVCFMFNNDDDIHANHIKFYFSQHWGRRPEATAEILALKERAIKANAFDPGNDATANATSSSLSSSSVKDEEDEIIYSEDETIDYSNVESFGYDYSSMMMDSSEFFSFESEDDDDTQVSFMDSLL